MNFNNILNYFRKNFTQRENINSPFIRYGKQALIQALKINTKLQILNVDLDMYNNTNYFTEVINARSDIVALKFSNNIHNIDIDSLEAINYLLEDLKTNTILQELELKSTNLSDLIVKELCNSLLYNTTLKILNLSNNSYITEIGCIELAKMLKVNKTLECLDLSYCSLVYNLDLSNGTSVFSPKGIEELICTLYMNETLTSLNLEGIFRYIDNNPNYQNKFILQLTNMLKENSTLKSVKLCRNNLYEHDYKLIDEMLNINSSLIYMELEYKNQYDISIKNKLERNKHNIQQKSLSLLNILS